VDLAGPAANDSALMKIGFFEYLCASSARQRIAAAEPSLTPEQSKTPSMPATRGDLQMVSIGTSFRNCAFGFFAPFLWFFHAMRASTCNLPSRRTREAVLRAALGPIGATTCSVRGDRKASLYIA
jgi:hypothetical protein